jgi:hypothetical protein
MAAERIMKFVAAVSSSTSSSLAPTYSRSAGSVLSRQIAAAPERGPEHPQRAQVPYSCAHDHNWLRCPYVSSHVGAGAQAR